MDNSTKIKFVFILFLLCTPGIITLFCGCNAEKVGTKTSSEKEGQSLNTATENLTSDVIPEKTDNRNKNTAEMVSREKQTPDNTDIFKLTDAQLEEALQNFAKTFEHDPEIAKMEEPIKITYYFIRALQQKDNKTLLALLSTAARAEWRKKQTSFGPSACENMEVEFGNIQYLNDPETKEVIGARIGTIWKIHDENSDSPSDTYEDMIVCVLRKEESQQWKMAGMIAVVSEDFPPIILNFEDLQEMEYMNENIDKEIQSRMENQKNEKTQNTTTPENSSTHPSKEVLIPLLPETEQNVEEKTEENAKN
ncbi:MAG: hypothetical protein Q4C96_06790 [Planctomycetia bacterium]|nr:hypothetical protein [Planctomycetia bacterium]